MELLWDLSLILLSIWGFWKAERVRKNPELFLDGVMVRYTHSLVLFIYASGAARKEVPQLLATDEGIRQKYLIETYFAIILLFIAGVIRIFLI